MSAGAINFWALVTVGAALLLLALFGRKGRNGLALGALAVGVIAGVALTVSGFMLMEGWPAQMERFDFSGFEPTMNVGGTSSGGGTMFAIYFWPSEAVALGAFVTYLFGRQLVCRVRTSRS